MILQRLSNARQKVDIELITKDKDTGEALSGAVFGLSSKKDIRSYDGKLLVKKGELIETVVSDENGRVRFYCFIFHCPYMKSGN